MRSKEETFSGEMSSLSSMLTWVRHELSHTSLDLVQQQRLEVAFEEALVNIISHSSSATRIRIKITFLLDPSPEILCEIFDWAAPFNPLSVVPFQPASSLEDQPLGGVGLNILRAYVDDLFYTRLKNGNLLSFKKKIDKTPS